MNKKLLPYLISLSLIIPGVLAAPTVKGGLTDFANGMKGLFRGNIGQFIDGLLGAAPVIGLFVVVFGLVFFLTKLTLFKDDAHSKYARMIAIGIGLIGIAQQSVFDTILGWSTLFLIVGFILAVVFMIVIFINNNRKEHYATNKAMFNAQGEYFAAKSDAKKARRDLNKTTHELALDEKLYSKTERDLESLNNDLQDLNRLYGDELQQVDRLADLLRKATAAANRGENNQVHGYVQALSRDLGGLISKMQHERHDMSKAHQLLDHIRKNLAYAFKDEKDELNEEDHLRKIIKRHLEHHQRVVGYDDDKIGKIEKHIYKEGTDIHKHLLSIKNAALHLRTLEDRIEKHVEKMGQFDYQPKHDAAAAVRDAAMTQDFTEAHKQLDHLRSLIEHGRQQAGDIHGLEQEMRSLVSQIENHDRALKILIAGIKHDFEKELAEDKKEVKQEKSVLKDVQKIVEKIKKNNDKLHKEYVDAVKDSKKHGIYKDADKRDAIDKVQKGVAGKIDGLNWGMTDKDTLIKEVNEALGYVKSLLEKGKPVYSEHGDDLPGFDYYNQMVKGVDKALKEMANAKP